ncbi:TonB-dependent receptor [Shewanella sp.]|uniref:TonB-dependent receptor n=1 Tax=Shewanella sp. TaxID=50422 RepID=UPI003A97B088
MVTLPNRPALLPLVVGSLLLPFSAAHADDANNAIEKITVTGEKGRRSMQDTAASVDVTTAWQIEQENIQSLYDILSKTPNVSQMYGNRGFTIRGISDEAGAVNPLTTIYLDGVPLPSQIADTGPSDLWDVAQVEVLRGPQSTIQGENALAGAVVINTQAPTMDWRGKARVQWSDPDDKRLSVATGGPLIQDELAFRFAADKHLFDGFTDNPTRGSKEDRLNSLMLRGKLLWTPSAISGLSVKLSYTRDDRDGPYMYTYNRLDLPGRVNTSDYANRSNAQTDLLALNVDYQLNEHWLLSSNTSHSESDVYRRYDVDLRADDIGWANRKEHYQVLTQEFRANYQGEELTAVMGLYASQHKTRSDLATLNSIVTPLPTINALLQSYGLDSDTAGTIANNYGAALPIIPVDYQSFDDTKSKNQALFADLDYRLSDNWSVQLGFRYDHQTYDYRSITAGRFTGSLPDPDAFAPSGSMLNQLVGGINDAVLNLVMQTNGDNPQTSTTNDTFLPKFGLRYRINDDTSVTATYQQAYRSGGSNFNIARSQVFEYAPEYTDNYEIAWRQELPNLNAVFNANLYYVDWQDKQVTATFGLNNYDTHTVNAGSAHLYGLEASIKQQLSADVDWYLSYGYSKTQFDQFAAVLGGNINDYSGEEFSYAPNHTASAGVNIYLSDNLSWNINANYRSRVYNDLSANRIELASRTLFNTRIAYDADSWSTYLFAQNLFDRDYVQYIRSANDGIIGAPRVIGIGVEARW